MTGNHEKPSYTEVIVRHDERLAAMHADLRDLTDEVKALRREMNGRVRSLEKWRNYLLGGVAAAAAVGLPEGLGWLARWLGE